MFTALRACGRTAPLDALISPRYVSSGYGSTLTDLKRVADDYGVHAVAMRGMTAAMLRDSQSPVLLHVSTIRLGSPFSHWIVYLGVSNGQARIIDPPGGPEMVSFADILCRWDGVGLVVSSDEIQSPRVMRLGWIEEGTFALAGVMAVLLISTVFGRTRGSVKGGLVGIACVSVALALGNYWLSPDGFGRNRQAIANVLTTHHAKHIPEVSIEELRATPQDDQHVLIDARRAIDFAAGAIPHAVNIPIGSPASRRTQLFSPIPLDAAIVVYCQSDKCGYSDEIGSDLIFRGYQDVSIYRGGYLEWTSQVAPK